VGLVSLLLSFNGRINRLQYWLGSFGVGIGAVMLIFLLALITGATLPMGKNAGLQGAVALLVIIGLVSIVSSWAGLALQVKRFHDRNQPGWLCLLPVLPMMGLMSSAVGGALGGQTAGQFAASIQPYVLVLWAINLFFFVNLGCLAGTDGPNKYGDPPGSPRSPSSDPQPSRQPAQAAFSLGSAEAAIERAIAERSRIAPVRSARPAAAPAGAAAAPASFGRRPAR
jgi:uncharacterized membrane protein YhaH (DUF805 family)